jgi:hypothetical protein
LVVDMAKGSGAGLASSSGVADFWLLVRLAPGPSPGDWIVSWFLPAAAVIAFTLVEGSGFRPALRHLLAAGAGLFLAWGASAGHLPEYASNAPAYLAVAALGYSAVIALGLSSAVPALGGKTFGAHQVGVAALATLLGAGLVLQSVQAARGEWDTGANALPPAWPVVAAADPGQSFRVLWLGREGGEELPPPAGDPDGVVTVGGRSLRYAIGGRSGGSALDLGRRAEGAGYGYLEDVIATVLAGTSRHVGALLSPLAVRYIVAADGDLPGGVMASLDRQLDLDLIPAGGLVIFRNAAALPRAGIVRTAGFSEAARAADRNLLPELPPPTWSPLRRDEGGFRAVERVEEAGYAFVAEQLAPGWKLEGTEAAEETERAFGWAIGAETSGRSGPVVVRFTAQRSRTLQVFGLAVLWLAALWITRKPARREEARGGPAVDRSLPAEIPAGRTPG